MRLSYLLQEKFPASLEDVEVTGLSLDSRTLKPQELFIALKGTQVDGRKYINDAIVKGVIAVLVEAENQNEMLTWQQNVPLIPVWKLQDFVGHLAARFYANPATKLRMIGVTGTSGKTSCTHFIAQLFHALQIPCGIIGTLGCGFFDALNETGMTTPDAIRLQSALQYFVQQGAKAIAMEVSSHSIDQARINGIPFEIGIFTNLSQDHLDYHGDMKTYAAVKKRFLVEFPTKQVIINADDNYGKEWINELATQKKVYAYSTQKNISLPDHVPLSYVDRMEFSLKGIHAHVCTPWGEGELSLSLIGKFNLSNVLAVLTALCVYGVPLSQVLSLLSQLRTVPGRMQIINGADKPLVVVDYAHKPDALEKVLQALRQHTSGKLICVFGCGGERDRGKRPQMAKIAEQWSDCVMITNDNPRHENPEAIAAEIMRGFSHPERVVIELDRSKAINNSIQCATEKDCILIAGKGAERYQQIGDEKIPFDDVEQVQKFLETFSCH